MLNNQYWVGMRGPCLSLLTLSCEWELASSSHIEENANKTTC